MKEMLRRLSYLLSRNRRGRELEDEMVFHREMAERAGRPEARRTFGSPVRLQEQAREAWGWTWIDRLGQDLRYGARMLSRSPGFTLLAVLVLAVGIGVNVSAFSLFNMVALKPLPVRDPASIVPADFANREDEGVLLVPKAGERLYRLETRPKWAGGI